ncbi:hypothetical protein QJS04_geneDACA020380 [Acorus gramineus]|uniref:Uncharacterized protein n=1 Tax=Acorus gramineus TaxID=55184 RepID=A0AAV9A0Q6_ACOGR|nr:hypothetical protein QJS04_geneDACA024476 [Acorus gramineus]KAK1257737.1 hypothetical protein QJS04_geneDACA024473 [Acorus gramineus]KAK1257740.1 hypothetical protein QJS04_geneDACA024470 [Acorus gramineus]KAK1257784.1 hypothetical protein QJS04_geneDACA024601 [Acorus gramineus]KAK1257817.1 hypothetical protein QJS04_geneDACA024608 [Acorus gramineus]
MKNVAKCDTWCELQNPVNHRVFERKLRPRPIGSRARLPGRHAFRRSAASSPPDGGDRPGCGCWPSVPRGRSAETQGPLRVAARHCGGLRGRVPTSGVGCLARPRVTAGPRERTPPLPQRQCGSRPQVRRGHPLSLSISISGGEETYEDSPSNGERNGKSPA